MFESASLSHRVEKTAYRREEPKLRQSLLDAQYDLLRSGKFATLILIAGVEGAGKGETVNLLSEWMDPRHIEVSGFGLPSDEESERPRLWRYWRALPPKGKIGIFFGAWHTQPIVERVQGRIDAARFEQEMTEILRLERMLVDEGVLLLKFWFHLSKPQQKKRLRQLEKDPVTAWRVTKADWNLYKHYDDFTAVCEPFVRKTSTGEAPWLVVAGADERYRSLTVGRTLLAALRERLDEQPVDRLPDRNPPLLPAVDKLNVLRALQLDQPLAKAAYSRQLEELSGRLNRLFRDPRMKEMAVVAVFEGNDAAGKGGPSAASRAPLMHAATRPCQWRRRARRSARSPTCGASGATCRAAAGCSSSIAPGMAACWSSGSRASARSPTGCAPTPRSTISSSSLPGTG